jgi:hypothetical protein
MAGHSGSHEEEATEEVGRTKPAVDKRLIPYGKKRKHEMAAYSKRHYGRKEWRLKNPKVIVEHYAVTATLAGIVNTFRTDQPDVEFGELPNVCSHFAVNDKGRIQQYVPLSIRCRHTVGLNDRSIGIEHTGFSDGQVLSDKDQMHSSLKLTKWLRWQVRHLDRERHRPQRKPLFSVSPRKGEEHAPPDPRRFQARINEEVQEAAA